MNHCALDWQAHPQNWSRVCKQQTRRKWPTLLSRYSCRDWTKLKANYRCDFSKGENLLMACGYQSSEATHSDWGLLNSRTTAPIQPAWPTQQGRDPSGYLP